MPIHILEKLAEPIDPNMLPPESPKKGTRNPKLDTGLDMSLASPKIRSPLKDSRNYDDIN